jgi:hypothetical protein
MTRDGWKTVLRGSGMSLVASTVSRSIEPSFVLEHGNPTQLLRLEHAEVGPEQVKALRAFIATKLQVEICYCSLYDECQRMIFKDNEAAT